MSVSDLFCDQLLLQIFKFVLGDSPTILPARQKDDKRMLSHVCRRWRILVLETPDFWTDFKFLPLPMNCELRLHEMTTTMLHRSRERSLNLNFDYCNMTRAEPNKALTDPPRHAYQLLYGRGQIDIIARILLPFRSQIRSLKWTVPTKHIIKTFLSIPPGAFPLLEVLEITFLNELPQHPQNTYFTEIERDNFTVSLGLLALRRVTLHIMNGMDPLSLRLPLGNITMLDLGSMSMAPDTFADIIFQGAPSLVEGFFHIEFTPSTKSNEPVPLYIRQACGRNIRRLRLMLTAPSNDERLFSLVTFPIIEELKIDYCDAEHGWKFSLIANMLKESSNTLEILSLESFSTPPASRNYVPHEAVLHQCSVYHTELEPLCKSLPNLVALHLPFGVTVRSDFLKKFVKGTLLPNLEVFALSSPRGSSVLRAVQRRNEIALARMSRPGSSTARTRLRYLSLLALAVPKETKADVEAECAKLKGDTGLRATRVLVGAEK